MRNKILATVMVFVLGTVVLAGGNTAQAKIKTAAMVINNQYYGTAQAIVNASSASASTAFGTPVVETKVSATYRYNKANGSKGIMEKSKTGTQSCSVEFSHDNSYSIISDHKASCSEGSDSDHIELVY